MAVRRGKELMLKTMLEKMWLREKDGQNTYTCLYTTLNSVALTQFNNVNELYKFVLNTPIDMIYIKTPYGEHQIYTDKLDTYRYELTKLILTMTTGSKTVIKLI